MNKTMLKIKILYDKMGKAEKKIADWLFLNPGQLIPLSIIELAEKCCCSEATIVRFAKRIGFGGYQELKISIAREEGKTEITEGITKDDSCFEIFDKVSNEIYCSLEMTYKDCFLNKNGKKRVFSDKKIRAGEKLLKTAKIKITEENCLYLTMKTNISYLK